MASNQRLCRRPRSVQSRFKTATSDTYISNTELVSIVNGTSKIKALEPGERHLKKTNWILSKAVKWLSMTNNQHHGEGWWGHQRNRRCERSRGSWWGRLLRQASGQRGAIPLLRQHNWTVSHCGQLGYCVHDGVIDNPAVDFFQAWDLASFELRASNLTLTKSSTGLTSPAKQRKKPTI